MPCSFAVQLRCSLVTDRCGYASYSRLASQQKPSGILRHLFPDRPLDAGAGACILSEPKVAEVVCVTLRFFDRDRYDLDEWVVMPNHVHAIVRPKDGWWLSKILHSWKLKIAREANRMLTRKNVRFWQPESFDRVIRDDEEKARVRRYIRRNPVKAGLCAREEEWRWGSAWEGWAGEK